MVDFVIKVIADVQSAVTNIKQAGRELENVKTSVDRLRGLIRDAFVFAGIGVGIKAITDLADAYTQAQNRIRTVTKSSAELEVVMQELFKVSAATGVNFNTVVETYTRTASAAAKLGRSQQELIDFSKRLNEAVVLSGATSNEAAGALIQLSQGIGSATLRGQELRAVLTELPAVADIIVEEFNRMAGKAIYTRASLHDLGKEGKITPQIILDAFKHAGEEIDAKFAHTLPTIQRSIQTLRTNLIKLLGDFNTASGAQGSFANAILFVADNLATVARVALAASIVIGIQFAQKALKVATLAAYEFAGALLANPLVAFVQLIVVATALLLAFGDQIQLGGGHIADVRDLAIVAFQDIKEGIRSMVNYFTTNFPILAEIGDKVFGSLGDGFSGFVKFFFGLAAGIVGIGGGTVEVIVNAFRKIVPSFKLIFTEALNAAIDIVESGINKITGALDTVLSKVGISGIGKLNLGRIDDFDTAKELASIPNAADSFKHGSEVAGGGIAQAGLTLLDQADAHAQKRIAEQKAHQKELDAARAGLSIPGELGLNSSGDGKKRDVFTATIQRLKEENAALGLNHQARELANKEIELEYKLKRPLTETEKQLYESLLAENQLLKDKANILDKLREPQEALQRGQAAINSLYAEGKITLEEYNTKLRELQLGSLAAGRDMETGLKRGLLTIQEEFGNVANLASETLVGAFRKAEDAIVEFAQTGKFHFKDLVSSILSDLTRLAVRQNITAPIANFLGLGGGGGAGGAGGIGGLLTSGFSSLFGSQGSVARLAQTGSSDFVGPLQQSSFFSNIGSILGFATGGSFQVGGSGPTDSKLIQFRATPGEMVNISKPGSASNDNNSGSGQSDRHKAPTNVIFNISTPDVESFRRSQSQMASDAARFIGGSRRNQ